MGHFGKPMPFAWIWPDPEEVVATGGGPPADALTLSDNVTLITLSDGVTDILAYPF